MLYYITSGESHGKAVIAVISGFPAGYMIDVEAMNVDLSLRQGGYGRGARQKIESDNVEILSGVRRGKTLGSPITLAIFNKDVRIDNIEEENVPRPGHAEFAGAIKFGTHNVRDISERASARETAARVAAGSLAKQFLSRLGVETLGFVRSIGNARWTGEIESIVQEKELRNSSEVYCPDKKASDEMVKAIDEAGKTGDTLGGIVEVRASGVIPGLGSCMNWDERLDGNLARAVMSINSVKGFETGKGFKLAEAKGKDTADPIACKEEGILRTSNNAGGIEGGMTNGEDIIIRAAFKPIPTTNPPAASIDILTGKEASRDWERSDICAVPAGAIIAEAVVSFELMREYCRKFGGDGADELKSNLDSYRDKAGKFLKKVKK